MKKLSDIATIIKLWQLYCLTKRKYKISQYFRSYKIRKLHIGSGKNIIEGWFNTDLIPPRNMNVVFLNAADKFPFEDNTFDYIFSEHLIEHITYEKGYLMLQECHRILKKNGIIRIATPDIHFLIELYKNDKTDLQKEYIKWAIDNFCIIGSETETCSETFILNNFFHNWGHKFIYDFEILRNMLKKIGFINVRRSPVGESDDKVLQGLECHWMKIPKQFNILETMVIEAVKSFNKKGGKE